MSSIQKWVRCFVGFVCVLLLSRLVTATSTTPSSTPIPWTTNIADTTHAPTASPTAAPADSSDDTPAPATPATTSSTKGVFQLLENEVWDSSTEAWKASGERWTNERAKATGSPSEVNPPDGFEFDGDWKIVVSGGDSMGWEYQFQYLKPPRRRRVWLRSLKQKTIILPPPAVKQQQQQSQQIITTTRTKTTSRSRTSTLSRMTSAMKDQWNFKGFGFAISKSLIFVPDTSISLKIPLTQNIMWWDRHTELPRLSSSVGIYFPLKFGASLSTSFRAETLKWAVLYLLQALPRFLLFVVFQAVLPLLWTCASTLVMPLKLRLPPLPQSPPLSLSKPVYKTEITERIGFTFGIRLSRMKGLEYRFQYWHTYLPTFNIYRNVLHIQKPVNAWAQKHFGCFGVQTGYPIPYPPHFSCNALLNFSGLYWNKNKSNDPSEVKTIASAAALQEAADSKAAQSAQLQKELSKAFDKKTTVSATSSHYDEPQEEKQREHVLSTKLITKSKSESAISSKV